jgi:uncharacterized protein YuzE
MKELGAWLSKTGKFSENSRPYAWEQVKQMKSLAWWEAWFSDSELCEVVKVLHKIPLSSAATERNWSLRGAIHTKIRNRMKVSTASQLTYIKHNTIIQNPQLFKKPLETSSSLESEAMDAIEADENVMDEIEVDENGNLFDIGI